MNNSDFKDFCQKDGSKACLEHAENRKNRVLRFHCDQKIVSIEKNKRHFRHLHEKLGILKKKFAPKNQFLADF